MQWLFDLWSLVNQLMVTGSPYATSPSAYSPALNSPASPAYSLNSELRGTPGGGASTSGGGGSGSELDGIPHSEWVCINIHVLDRSSGGQAVVQEILVSNGILSKSLKHSLCFFRVT